MGLYALYAKADARMQRVPQLFVLALTLAFTLVCAVQAHNRILKQARVGNIHGDVNDVERFRVITRDLLQNKSDYHNDGLPNPPIVWVMLAPLTALSAADAQFAWALAKWFMLVPIAYICWQMARQSGIHLRPAAMLLGALVWMCPIVGDIQEGNTNLLMLLPLVAGLALAQAAEPDRPLACPGNARNWKTVAAGLLVALAISIKVTPLIFLVYFLLRRRWLLSASILLGLGVWLVFVPGLALGWRQNLTWLQQWAQVMIIPYVTTGHVKYFTGQSLPALIARLLRHVPAMTDGHNNNRPIYVNIADLSERAVNIITRAVLLLIALAGLFWLRRPLRTMRSLRYLVEIGAVSIFMLWASERTWVHHYVSVVLAILAVCAIVSTPAEPDPSRRRGVLMLTIAILFMLATSDVALIAGRQGVFLAQGLGAAIWAAAALLYALMRSQAARPTPPSPTTH